MKIVKTIKSEFEIACDEIRHGPFSILSETAQDRIILLIRVAMEDAYDRGYKAGMNAS